MKKKQADLPVREAAKILGLSEHTVRYHIREGHLPVIRSRPYMLSWAIVKKFKPDRSGPKT